MKKKQLRYTYADIECLAKKVAAKIKQNTSLYKPTIVTHTKGGTFTSAFVSKYLNWKPSIVSLGSSSSDIWWPGPFIVLDDILDTGKTVSVHSEARDCTAYFLFDKPGAHRIYTPPRYFAAETIAEETWCVFPWE